MNLVHLCIEAASESAASVETWRRQRRTLEKIPPELADSLLHRLLRRRLVSPSLLEVFQHCVEEIDLGSENSVNEEWMAYLGGFRRLRKLNIADCRAINNTALWAITGMDSLKELDLSRCVKVTDVGIQNIISISNLEKLSISETAVTSKGISWLSSLRNLSKLDLGGLPVTDQALCSLQVLTKLEYLDLWGSKISDKGATILKKFRHLSYLNLAWTDVTKLPWLPFLRCLNMSNCMIHAIFGGESKVKVPLMQLIVHGATILDVNEVFSHIEARQLSLLDVSNSSLNDFRFLANMDKLTDLNLSFSKIEDEFELMAHLGTNLRNLNLSNTRVTSDGVGTLAGKVPNLEHLSLSHTSIDDVALSYISLMPALKVIELSDTQIKGFTYERRNGQDHQASSFTILQGLNYLEKLNLEETHVKDEALKPLTRLKGLKSLYLKSDFITDVSLHAFSSLPKLRFLSIREAVLTDSGLYLFNPPPMLESLDIRGCWLLTADALSLFHENHPQIKVRHECAQICSMSENGCRHSSPQQGTRSSSKSKSKKDKGSPSISRKEWFIDERLKYSREELLELQSKPVSHTSPSDFGIVLPTSLTE